MQWLLLVAEPIPLDSAWLKANPAPSHDDDVDKNARGVVLVIGGSRTVPGGILLTAEAAFRAGAGKVTIASIASIAMGLGIALPECGIISLPETPGGEIAVPTDHALLEALEFADAIVVGPAMIDSHSAAEILSMVLDIIRADQLLIVDAAAIRAAETLQHRLRARGGNSILTPHCGEMAALLTVDRDQVIAKPLDVLQQAVTRYGAITMIKGATSFISDGETTLSYAGGGIGLATGGSGDVLAGLIAAMGAQGLGTLPAAAWGIWLHGEAGRRLGESTGPLGYLARELLTLIPALMRGVRP